VLTPAGYDLVPTMAADVHPWRALHPKEFA
jgi:hypothetical protein